MMRNLFVLLTIFVCSPGLAFAEVGEHRHAHQHHGAELPATEPSNDSVYLTESIWTTTEKEEIQLRKLRGTPQIVALFYASCDSACPAIVEAMKKIEREFSKKGQNRLGFVLVTFDPQEDSPEVLKAYAKKRGLTQPRWQLLSGSEDDTRELAVLLGSKYKRNAPKNYSHTNLITLLDDEGRIVHRAKTLGALEQFITEVDFYLQEADSPNK